MYTSSTVITFLGEKELVALPFLYLRLVYCILVCLFFLFVALVGYVL